MSWFNRSLDLGFLWHATERLVRTTGNATTRLPSQLDCGWGPKLFCSTTVAKGYRSILLPYHFDYYTLEVFLTQLNILSRPSEFRWQGRTSYPPTKVSCRRRTQGDVHHRESKVPGTMLRVCCPHGVPTSKDLVLGVLCTRYLVPASCGHFA